MKRIFALLIIIISFFTLWMLVFNIKHPCISYNYFLYYRQGYILVVPEYGRVKIPILYPEYVNWDRSCQLRK